VLLPANYVYRRSVLRWLGWLRSPAHVDEWSLSLTAEHHLAPSTIRSYHCGLRLFSEYLCAGRYGWIAACQKEWAAG
jgi:integrase/recombinase XerC